MHGVWRRLDSANRPHALEWTANAGESQLLAQVPQGVKDNLARLPIAMHNHHFGEPQPTKRRAVCSSIRPHQGVGHVEHIAARVRVLGGAGLVDESFERYPELRKNFRVLAHSQDWQNTT